MAATLFFIPKAIPLDATADVLSGALANFFISGTTTRQDTFNSETLNVAHDNPVEADGNGVFPPIYLDDTLNYKVDITDALGASLPGYPVDNLALSGLAADLASNANALGASLIGIEDVAASFTATDVEAALAEIIADLVSNANALGASTVGIEDSAAGFVATDVEAALAALGPVSVGTFTATLTGFVSNPTGTINFVVNGGFCCLYNDGSLISDTSNTTAMTMTGLPAAVQPLNATTVPTEALRDNSVGANSGAATISGAVVSFLIGSPRSGTGFTAANDKGVDAGWAIIYPLD